MSVGLLADSSICMFPDYPEQEIAYVEHLCSKDKPSEKNVTSILSSQIQKARDQIKTSLERASAIPTLDLKRIDELENTVNQLVQRLASLETKISKLNELSQEPEIKPSMTEKSSSSNKECDLFGSDDDDDDEPIVPAPKVETSKKPKPVAKSTIVLDVKPWSDETDVEEINRLVRSIQADGLIWGQHKFVEVAYGIKKLQIGCVVEDDKIGIDFLETSILAFEDHVQSVDIASFQKI